jgi:hypothetical protein
MELGRIISTFNKLILKDAPSQALSGMVLLRAFGPTISAIIINRLISGKEGIFNLLCRVIA